VTSGGVDQFLQPMLVTRVTDGHVFVEDLPTGIPMNQATTVSPPNKVEQTTPAMPTGGAPSAPVNPPVSPRSTSGIKQDVFTVQEGHVLLQWPASLSKESVEDIDDWLKLIVRKAKRAAGIQPNETIAK
jgi:hypothetical protein